jgi:hypothetical protein
MIAMFWQPVAWMVLRPEIARWAAPARTHWAMT